MKFRNLFFFFVLIAPTLPASLKAERIESSTMKVILPNDLVLKEDFNRIIKKSPHNNITLSFQNSGQPSVTISCKEKRISLQVSGDRKHWSENFYLGIQKLGFYFPHPRRQINPTSDQLNSHCNQTFTFEPSFPYRGFHLHTLHASEWVEGFLMGKTEVAKETIRWLARNMQNTFDLSLLRMKRDKLKSYLKPLFQFSKDLGIYPGVSLGISLHQQNSYKLLGLIRSVTGFRSKEVLRKNLQKLIDDLDPSFITLEAGTSEFTPVNYERAIAWMNEAGKLTRKQGIQTFIKVHVSSNQNHPKYGNFNFLPKYSDSSVGVWPHTVMFYSIYDEYVPMYGNKTFSHIKTFMEEEAPKRPTWYYPETSYYIGMDIDAPLFLTTYLTNRSLEMDKLSEQAIEGHINFTTGHEVGYWLMDWTVALLGNKEFKFDPYVALNILGEKKNVWEKIVRFQDEYFKDKGLISILSFPNFQDELTPKHRIHERNTLKELLKDKRKLESEIQLLESAIAERPTEELVDSINDPDLKLRIKVTFARMDHALQTRLSLAHPKASPERESHLLRAKKIREKFLGQITDQDVIYPELNVFKKFKNPSSYDYGYGYAAKTLHFWEREEEQARKEKFSPLFMNIWDVVDIVI